MDHKTDVDAAPVDAAPVDAVVLPRSRLMVSFEIPENFDDGFKLMAIWQAAYKQFGLGLSGHERNAAKRWFDSWYDSQQVGR